MFAVPKPMLMTARLASCLLAVTSQIYWVSARKLREGENDADQIETIPFLSEVISSALLGALRREALHATTLDHVKRR
jgi:hypothetical protein